jgi:subtilase family protein/fervidolysin-like protein
MDRERRNRSSSRLFVLAPAILAALFLGGTESAAAPIRAAAKPAKEAVPGELLIGFREGVSAAEQQKLLKKIGALEKRKFKRIRGAMIALRPDAVAHALERLRDDDRVRYAEPNFIVHADALPNDPSFFRLWGLNNGGQSVGGVPSVPDADIDAPEAWNVTTGSYNVTVAVIDTGVDYTHSDLSSAIWINSGEDCPGCRTDGLDNDGNGYVDDWRGWDFVNDDNAPADDHGHGTHVAGTIGAQGDNGIGVTGVSWRVRLMSLKFLSASGTGSTADAVSAVLYAAEQGAEVLNNSWGGDEYSQALADAIGVADADDSLFVAAAGNDGSDNDAFPTYPSSYDLPNVVSVAATDNRDGLAWFSNVGRRSVDLGAPGVNVYSTWPGNSYQYLSGTSMAAPHLSGAAALAKAAFPGATDVGLKALLLGTTDPNQYLAGRTATGGRLNAAAAVGCNGSPKIWFDTPAAGFTVDVGTPVAISAIATRCAEPGADVTAAANGTPVPLTARGDGLYTGTYTPTAAGSLALSVTASAAGHTETRTVSGTASGAYTITPGGPAVTVTTRAPDENARIRFDGQAGQRISLKLSSVTISSSYVSILKPDGTTLAPNTYVSIFGGFLDTRALPVTGSYVIVVDPQGTYTGSMTLALYDVPPDAGGPIAFGTNVTFSTTAPGQNARYTFNGQAAQRVSVKLASGTITNSYVSILKPDGTALGGSTYVSSFGGFLDTRTLPATGIYTLLIDPLDAATGSTTLTLYDVPPDVTGTMVPGGSSLTATMGTPGQNARLSFDGRAGQRISLKLSAGTISNSYVSILKPDGAALGNNVYVSSYGGFVDTRTLPTAGTYTIFVDPQGAAAGSMTLTLYDVPPDTGGTITPGGPAATTTTTSPGQNARIAFDGQAGQRVSLKLSAVSIPSSYLSILKPDGSALGGNTYVGSSGGFLDTRTLPAAGSYTIVVDPQEAATGSMTLALYDVPPDATGTLTIGGPALTTSFATPGQNARITFDGRAGQRVSLKFSGVTVLFSYFSILRPDGGTLLSQTFVTTSGRAVTVDLPADGTYAIPVDPQGAEIGSSSMTLTPGT